MTVYSITLVALASMFSALYRLYSQFCRMPEAAYKSPVLALEALRHPAPALVILGTAIPAITARHRLQWQLIDPDGVIRLIIVTLCCFLAASHIVAKRNQFFRRSY